MNAVLRFAHWFRLCFLVFCDAGLIRFIGRKLILRNVNCVLTFVITFVGVIVSNVLTFVNTFFNAIFCRYFIVLLVLAEVLCSSDFA